MMKNIVCSLELALKLKEIGIENKSLFAYFKVPCSEWEIQLQTKPNLLGLPAYLAEELANLLPPKIIKYEYIEIYEEKYLFKYSYHIKISNFGIDEWHCCYIGYPVIDNLISIHSGSKSFGEHDPILSNAIAKMLIYLFENGLIKNKEKEI